MGVLLVFDKGNLKKGVYTTFLPFLIKEANFNKTCLIE